MNRMLLSALAASVLALAAPSVALAHHHGKHHHARRHAHARVHVLDFRSSGTSSTMTTSATPPTPATPTSMEPAGKVTSFTGGVLTITLKDGTEVKGKVTEATELQCVSATPQPGGDDDEGENGNSQGESHAFAQDSRAHASDFGQEGDDNGQGDDNGDGGSASSCGPEPLATGTSVLEAELSVTSAGAVWDHVVLLK